MTTDFWRDSWIAGIDPLIAYVPERLAPSLEYVLVAAMADGNGNWLWHKFEHLLPLNIRLRIVAAGCPMVGFAADAECWKGNVQGNFTVKSAYIIRCGPTVPDDARMATHPKDLDLLFGSICRNLWLERNAVVFDNPLDDRGTVLERSRRLQQQYLLAYSSTAPSMALAMRNGPAGSSINEVQRLLAEGWFQANSDAGCCLADGSAKCGGVIRSHDGRWVQGVAKFIELRQGRALSSLLRKHLHPSSPPQTRQVLLHKILCSYDNALSLLNWTGFTSTAPIATHASHKIHTSKQRKTCSGRSEQIRVCSLEGPLEDGYCWRKYGQKDILGSNFPRGYYRCTHRYSQGCLAAKQVQRSDEDPTIFEVKYRGRHTCNRASHSVAMKVPSTTESEEKANHSRIKQQQQHEEKQKQSKEILMSFETEDLDNRDDIFPSFPFPIESEQVGNGLFVKSLMENDIGFVSPAASESNYFSVSPFHMGSFVLDQNMQTSESDLTEIISAPTSVTDISSLDKLEFDPSFPFDNPDFFT
ncbi:hypothetical protein V6N13_032174 [Hibiscus sabdariffa]